jgi:hypothetical protein
MIYVIPLQKTGIETRYRWALLSIRVRLVPTVNTTDLRGFDLLLLAYLPHMGEYRYSFTTQPASI